MGYHRILNSLCYTVGLCCLSILYVVVCPHLFNLVAILLYTHFKTTRLHEHSQFIHQHSLWVVSLFKEKPWPSWAPY